MEILNIGKALLKLGLLLIEAVSGSDKTTRNQTSIYGSFEAHELYEEGEISLSEFLRATRP